MGIKTPLLLAIYLVAMLVMADATGPDQHLQRVAAQYRLHQLAQYLEDSPNTDVYIDCPAWFDLYGDHCVPPEDPAIIARLQESQRVNEQLRGCYSAFPFGPRLSSFTRISQCVELLSSQSPD